MTEYTLTQRADIHSESGSNLNATAMTMDSNDLKLKVNGQSISTLNAL